MLVLSRKVGQAVELPELGVTIRVIKINGSRTQLGIDAPDDIRITRPERSRQVEESDLAKQSGLAEQIRQAEQSGLQETYRIREELSRVEAHLASVAELSEPQDIEIARRLASDAIDRLEGIRRSLRVESSRSPTKVRPMADFVRVRAEVLAELEQTPQASTRTAPTMESKMQTAEEVSERRYCAISNQSNRLSESRSCYKISHENPEILEIA